MRERFDDQNPDLKVVVAEYRDAMRRRLRWVGPVLGGVVLLALVLSGLYSVEPGEVGVVRTFGKEGGWTQPGLHFAIPLVQRVDIVDLAKIRRAEVGFRTTKAGPKRVDQEALMLTGDANIVEAQMIVQYQVQEPSKYLFKLKDAEVTLQIAAEVALRGVVGQTSITADLASEDGGLATADPSGDGTRKEGDATAPAASAAPAASGVPAASAAATASAAPPGSPPKAPALDILTTGREQAQVEVKQRLQELMNLYQSGVHVTEVKLQAVDAPDEVKDAFHDVVRAREEREQKINKALGYREDRIPRARGEAQKILRAAEAYKAARVLRAEGEASRFSALLTEYEKAPQVMRKRLYLETMEQILQKVSRKVLVDKDVAKGVLPFLPLGPQGAPAPAPAEGGR